MTADKLEEAGIIDRPEFLGSGGPGGQKFVQLVGSQQPGLFPDYGIPGSIATLMRQTIWELYLQRVIAPTPEKASTVDRSIPHKHADSWVHLDVFVLTPYGVNLLLDSKNRIRVYDPDGYLANFWSAKPSPDSEMMRYLGECVSVFRSNHLLASVVLLGVASERLIEVLAESLRDALGDPDGTSWYSGYRKHKAISKKFSSIGNKLKEEYKQLDLNSDAFRAAELTFQYIRLARNDIAHPKDRQFTSNEVGGFIHNFVQYFEYINHVIALLAKNPKTAS
ncbi:MAG: hypothetical protein GXP38_06930 [Chloroflexi bacterium]|nr:hypothetical protein [Chloroflexota bacterium]